MLRLSNKNDLRTRNGKEPIIMYIFYPLYGLANRMRVMDSAYRFCKTHKKKFVICWEKDHVVNCKFNKLFVPLAHLKESNSYRFVLFLHKLERHFAIARWCVKLLEKCHILKIFNQEQYLELRAYTAKGGDKFLFVLVESYSVFYQTEQDEYLRELFTLKNEMSDRLQKETKDFKENIIGVHIRRTDNKESIEKSPLDLFVSRIQKEIDIDNDVQFYVASDDPNVKQKLLDLFGTEQIIVPTGIISRDSEEGIKQAVVEMYALSKTKLLLGCHNSSFSTAASMIGKIPKETISIS